MLTLLNDATAITRRFSLALTEDDLVVVARALGHCRRPEDLPDHQDEQGHVALLHDAFSAAVAAHGLTLVWDMADSHDQTTAAA
tara:strand:+ start:189 stop:440 length:252 start_codon:yes stop_codon:yes gene_type:complete